ncbi:HU family DNA-binding protein [Methylicorpusculum oleiharenae]
MNKSEFIDVIAQQAQLTKADSARALHGLLNTIQTTLKEGIPSPWSDLAVLKSKPAPNGPVGIVRPRGQLINRVEVPVGVSHNAVAESNCVIAKWGGEQLEAKRQSVG